MHLKSTIVLLLGAHLLARSLSAAQAGHEHTPGAHGGMGGASGAADLGATAAFDSRGVLWAAHKAQGAVAVSRSEDLGKTWSAPVAVTREPEPTDPGGDARPKIALGTGDEIYVTWTRPMTAPYSGEIRFTRSLDGGRSFDPPRTVHADRQEITHRFDALTVTATGAVFVAWVDKRDVVAAQRAGGGAYRGAAIYYAVSHDRGETFAGDVKLADHSCECCRIALVPRPDGSVAAMWRHIFEPNVRDHAMAEIAADGSVGPIERASFDDWAVDACPHQGPALAVDDRGRRHAVWFTAAPKNAGVFYGRPTTAGVEGLRKIGNGTAERADIAVLDSRVAMAWKEFDGTRSQLRGMLSKDGGNTWETLSLASTAAASDHPRLLKWKGRFYVFWNTRQEPLSLTPFP